MRSAIAGGVLLVALAASSASAYSVFDYVQKATVSSDGYTDVLFYNYTTGEMNSSGAIFGNAVANYTTTYGQWKGVFLYDYSTGGWSNSMHARMDP